MGSQRSFFAQSTLVEFRARMIRTGVDRRLLERAVELAKTTAAFDSKNHPQTLHLAVHSSPLEVAAADSRVDPAGRESLDSRWPPRIGDAPRMTEEEQLRLKEFEAEIQQIRSELIDQEHRGFAILKNFFIERRRWTLDDPRRDAAARALLYRIFFSPGVAAAAGGALALLSAVLFGVQTFLLQQSLLQSNEQFQRARRTEVIEALYETVPNPAFESSEAQSADNQRTIPRANSRTRSEALIEFVKLERAKSVPVKLQRAELRDTAASHSDLGGVDFVGADLRDADFSGSTLSAADLRGANLCGANFSGADLSGADLTGAAASDTDLGGADLSSSDLRGANLGGTDLSGADLSRANLGGADLSRVQLVSANLTFADLRGATLSDASLNSADLRAANLRTADLRGVSLSRANLTGANCSQAFLVGADLSDADFSGADLSIADLRFAHLSGASLRDADLRGARLSGADLSGANLSGANFSGADLDVANLWGAILSGAILDDAGLIQSQIDQACTDPKVPPKLDGLDPPPRCRE